VENVYIILQQIYSGNSLPDFIGIVRVLWDILQKTFVLFFSGLGAYIKTFTTFSELRLRPMIEV